MELKDLKVVSANVQVDNSNQAESKYKISASFRTSNGAVKGIDGGSVIVKEDNKHVASFYRNLEFEGSSKEIERSRRIMNWKPGNVRV